MRIFFKTVLAMLVTTLLISCTCKQKDEEQTVINKISIEDLSKTKHSIQLLDVRTPEEYNEGYIDNAININFFDDDFVHKVSTNFDKNKPIFLYCKSGGRSGKASKKLKEAGFAKIYDLDGGFDKWIQKSKPITQNE